MMATLGQALGNGCVSKDRYRVFMSITLFAQNFIQEFKLRSCVLEVSLSGIHENLKADLGPHLSKLNVSLGMDMVVGRIEVAWLV